MPRSLARTREQARNHRVVAWINDPNDLDGFRGDLPWYSWVVGCEECGREWPPNTGHNGSPIGDWWLCPRVCNLSQRAALRFLRDLEAGRPVPDGVTREVCEEVINRTRLAVRAETLTRQDYAARVEAEDRIRAEEVADLLALFSTADEHDEEEEDELLRLLSE